MLDRLESLTGMSPKDLALIIGGAGLVLGLILLGIAGSHQKRRWLARLGWVGVMAGIVALIYGMRRGSAQAV